MLELIEKGSCTEAHPVPLMFVHGAWHAAWCWDQHFLDFFADQGYGTVAVSLRGHGRSNSPKPLRAHSLKDYVDDIASVADGMPRTPVVIGHSMGGAVVQKYLASHEAPAGVLLASVPPSGISRATMRLAKRHPWLVTKATLTGDTKPQLRTPPLARHYMFSESTPESLVADCVELFQQESKRALYLDLMFLGLPKPQDVTAPLLVLGAERDGTISTEEIRATARAYETEPELFPDMGHDMMLEPGWVAVAQRIHEWLETLHLGDEGTVRRPIAE